MSYQMYRSTTLGEALQQTLDELVADGLITPPLQQRVLATFDKCINHALSNRLKNKTTFKVGFLQFFISSFLGGETTSLPVL